MALPSSVAKRRGIGLGSPVARGVGFIIAILGGILFLVPFIWMMLTAFKSNSQIY